MAARLQYLREQYGSALLSAFRADPRNRRLDAWEARWIPLAAFQAPDRDAPDSSDQNQSAASIGEDLQDIGAVDAIFQRYRDADPTRTGACTQWLIRLAIAGKLPGEDLPKARKTLEAFLAYKGRLAKEARDLGRYETLGDAWAAVEPFILENAPTSNAEAERRERAQARAQSDILMEHDGWIVAVPKTENAACWWGRGTRWCTAADVGNYFYHYHEDGPLVVFIQPDGRKYQWHGPSQQFMDAADNNADIHAFTDIVGPLLMAERREGESDEQAARRQGLLLSMAIAHELAYPEVGEFSKAAMQAAVAHFETTLWKFPHAYIDRDLAMTAVRQQGGQLGAVPETMRDRAMCLAAVTNNGFALKHVPESLIDRDICWAAIASEGEAIKIAPHDLLDRSMCESAIRRMPSMIRFVPDHLVDRDLCRLAVDQGAHLSDIPFHLRDREICLSAVQAFGNALSCVPVPFRDREIYLAAVKKTTGMIGLVPEEIVDAAFCVEALNSLSPVDREFAIQFTIPKRLRHDVIEIINANDRAIEAAVRSTIRHGMARSGQENLDVPDYTGPVAMP